MWVVESLKCQARLSWNKKKLREKPLTVQAAIRGFHVHKTIWELKEEETISCDYEENNPMTQIMIQSNKQKCIQLISATGYERKLQGKNKIMAVITVNVTTVVTWTTLLLLTLLLLTLLIVFFKKYHWNIYKKSPYFMLIPFSSKKFPRQRIFK